MTNWRMTINTGQHLAKHEDGTATARQVADDISYEIEMQACDLMASLLIGEEAIDEARGLVDDFRMVGGNLDPHDDDEELMDCMSDLYDWADYWKVWLTPVMQARYDARKMGGGE